MTSKYNWIDVGHRKYLVDFSLDCLGKTMIFEEGVDDGYAIYWRSQCNIEDFIRYMNEFHKRNWLGAEDEEFGPHITYYFMRDGDADELSPSGNIDETFPTVEDMLNLVRREVGLKGRLLRLDTSKGNYIWDDYKTPSLGRIVCVINTGGTPVDNVVELFRLTSPTVDDEIISRLQNELPPTATSSDSE